MKQHYSQRYFRTENVNKIFLDRGPTPTWIKTCHFSKKKQKTKQKTKKNMPKSPKILKQTKLKKKL